MAAIVDQDNLEKKENDVDATIIVSFDDRSGSIA